MKLFDLFILCLLLLLGFSFIDIHSSSPIFQKSNTISGNTLLNITAKLAQKDLFLLEYHPNFLKSHKIIFQSSSPEISPMTAYFKTNLPLNPQLDQLEIILKKLSISSRHPSVIDLASNPPYVSY